MSLADITRPAVLAALDEWDRVGESAFVRKYAAAWWSYPLLHNGCRYDSRAVVGAAHGYATDRLLKSTEFTSEPETTALVLEQLGFEVDRGPGEEQETAVRDLLAAAVGVTAGEALALLWLLSQMRQGQPTEIDESGLDELLARYRVDGSASAVFGNLRAVRLWRKTDLGAALSDDALAVLGDDRAAAALADHLSDMRLMEVDLADLLRPARLSTTASGRAFRAWSLLTLSGDRDYQGNDGYADVTGETYTYDSRVTNHARIAEGDLVVLRDGDVALGSARVERIETEPDQPKLQRLCPNCGLTGFKPRKTMRTRYLCLKCRHEFDEPATREITVTVYRAHYAATWRPFGDEVAVAALEQLAINGAMQQSLRPLYASGAGELFGTPAVTTPHDSDRADRSSVRGGSRRAVVRVRDGQQDFRRMLLGWYGVRCAMTGPCPEQALQAAHLRGFAKHERHLREEGLLLRADVHLLFDRGLVAVDPERMVIVLAPEIRHYEPYAQLEGQPLHVDEDRLPDQSALAEHYATASAGWRT